MATADKLCSGCGELHRIPNGRLCASCWNRVRAAVPADRTVYPCPSCGSGMLEGEDECTECGARSDCGRRALAFAKGIGGRTVDYPGTKKLTGAAERFDMVVELDNLWRSYTALANEHQSATGKAMVLGPERDIYLSLRKRIREQPY